MSVAPLVTATDTTKVVEGRELMPFALAVRVRLAPAVPMMRALNVASPEVLVVTDPPEVIVPEERLSAIVGAPEEYETLLP